MKNKAPSGEPAPEKGQSVSVGCDAMVVWRETLMTSACRKLANSIAKRIEADVLDRRGWKQEWEYHFAHDTKKEIRATWRRLIESELLRVAGVKTQPDNAKVSHAAQISNE
jgi:hypothetical protein